MPITYSNHKRGCASILCKGCTEPPKRHVYSVGIRKDYFPIPAKRNANTMTAYQEVVRIRATSRIEAAEAVWRRWGALWLGLMKPDPTIAGNRIISLEVNDPVRRIGMGRIAPVKVYEGTGHTQLKGAD